MADSFRISEITPRHLARAAYPLVHAAHRELTLKDWLSRVRQLDARDGSQGIKAVQAGHGTIVAIFAFAVALGATPTSVSGRSAPERVLTVTEVVCCELPGLEIRPLIEAEARRIARELGCARVETIDCTMSRMESPSH